MRYIDEIIYYVLNVATYTLLPTTFLFRLAKGFCVNKNIPFSRDIANIDIVIVPINYCREYLMLICNQKAHQIGNGMLAIGVPTT